MNPALATASVCLLIIAGLAFAFVLLGWRRAVIALVLMLSGAVLALVWLTARAVDNDAIFIGALFGYVVLPAMVGAAIGGALGWLGRRIRHGA
jgi:hypothetical protein